MQLLYSVLGSLAVMLVSLIGLLTISRKVEQVVTKNISLLVSFSAGIFLVVALNLTTETLEHSGSFIEGAAWILVGALGLLFLFRLIPHFHHHHTDDLHKENKNHLEPRKILISDAIHNFGDGLLIAAAFYTSTFIGITALIGVLIHEIVQEISEFFVLREGGYSTKKAIFTNFLVSGGIMAGAITGSLLFGVGESFEIALLGVAAGGFLVVVLQDLIPYTVRTSHATKNYSRHILSFLLGLVVMVSLTALTNTSHSHEGGEVHSEEESH